MKTTVYANQDWQHIGKVPEPGNIYPEGKWAMGDGKECDAQGRFLPNFYSHPIHWQKEGYPYCGPGAYEGQLIYRNGVDGEPKPLTDPTHFMGTEDLWMRMNDGGLHDNSGSLNLRFASQALSDAKRKQSGPTNSYGDPLGTKY